MPKQILSKFWYDFVIMSKLTSIAVNNIFITQYIDIIPIMCMKVQHIPN